MMIRFRQDLLVINIIVFLFIFIISLFPDNTLRIVLGLAFLAFFPGYSLMAALFPGKDFPGNTERIALSCGLSFIIAALAGLFLHFTPWGIRLYPVLIVLAVVICSTSLIAWFRRRRLMDEERFSIELSVSLPSWKDLTSSGRTFIVLLGISILGTLGILFFVLVTPRVGESFTEFYILGTEGKVQDYPVSMEAGEIADFDTIIVNNEGEAITYQVELMINGERNQILGPISLNQGEQWQDTLVIKIDEPGRGQKVDLILYKNGSPDNCLYFWVDVSA